jgi:hypothetical protein
LFTFAAEFKKINKQMKKLALVLVIGAVAFMTSCGPSAKEIEEKRIADSTKVADSMAKVQAEQQRIADSIAKVQAAQKKVADSIAHQDSVKKHLIKPAKAAKKAKK